MPGPETAVAATLASRPLFICWFVALQNGAGEGNEEPPRPFLASRLVQARGQEPRAANRCRSLNLTPPSRRSNPTLGRARASSSPSHTYRPSQRLTASAVTAAALAQCRDYFLGRFFSSPPHLFFPRLKCSSHAKKKSLFTRGEEKGKQIF